MTKKQGKQARIAENQPERMEKQVEIPKTDDILFGEMRPKRKYRTRKGMIIGGVKLIRDCGIEGYSPHHRFWECECECNEIIKRREFALEYSLQTKTDLRCEKCAQAKEEAERLEQSRKQKQERRGRKKIVHKEGGIYLIAETGTNLYEIGYAKNVRHHLADLQAATHRTLRICHVVAAKCGEKKNLQNGFRGRRLPGKWFVFPDGMVDDVIARMDELEAG